VLPVSAVVGAAVPAAAEMGAAETEVVATEAAATEAAVKVAARAAVWAAAPAAVFISRWGLCPRCPVEGGYLSGVDISSLVGRELLQAFRLSCTLSCRLFSQLKSLEMWPRTIGLTPTLTLSCRLSLKLLSSQLTSRGMWPETISEGARP